MAHAVVGGIRRRARQQDRRPEQCGGIRIRGSDLRRLVPQTVRHRDAGLAAHRPVCLESQRPSRPWRRRRSACGARRLPLPGGALWSRAARPLVALGQRAVLSCAPNFHPHIESITMKRKHRSVDTRRYSSLVVDGIKQAPARAMLHAVGFADGDFRKPQIGIASTWSNLTPCNMHIDELARLAAAGVQANGAKPVTFATITVSDGISMGTPGMRYSLVSREVIADSIETVVGAQGFDGVVAIGGCDKNTPGCLMALARLNRPAVFVYGGTIRPGAQRRDIVSVFEAVGGVAAGKLSAAQLLEVERTAIPGA